ncbi:MAG: hypothetical protein WA948_13465 [Pontixanthobacter sp.]
MSANLHIQLVEDRAMRDAAKGLVKADVAHLKADFKGKSLGSRLSSRASDGAAEVFEEASAIAKDNKGVLAVLIAAISIWFARNPILSLFSDDDAGGDTTYDDLDREIHDRN